MNRVILMGRLVKDPTVTYSKTDTSMAICRYTLAVDRRFQKKDSQAPTADFISCVTFGKAAEFAEKYFHKGQRVLVEGRIQTGSYTNKDGQKVYTTDVVLDSQEFADSKGQASQSGEQSNGSDSVMDGFMNIPEGVEDELPFN